MVNRPNNLLIILKISFEGVKFGVNKFADLTNEGKRSWCRVTKNESIDLETLSTEFKKRVLMFEGAGLKAPEKLRERQAPERTISDPLPDSFDWRALGAVTNVSDQGQAGAEKIYSF
jgi:C1A family cysteine protease